MFTSIRKLVFENQARFVIFHTKRSYATVWEREVRSSMAYGKLRNYGIIVASNVSGWVNTALWYK